MTSTRVVIADDQALVRGGFRMIIDAKEEMAVAGEAGDGAEAVAVVERESPDVVLMDVRMPNVDGIEATRRIVASGSEARIIILTTYDLDEYVFSALRAGASGFLLKDVRPQDLVEAIRIVARGDALLAPSVTRRLLERFGNVLPEAPASAEGLEELTQREREVLRLVALALSNAEIANRLVLTEATVKTHVSAVLRKLGLRDRVQAVVLRLRRRPRASRAPPKVGAEIPYSRPMSEAGGERSVSSMTDAAIDIRGLGRRFGSVQAVSDLTFSVQAGRVTGFLGPNGAGKSTTLRMLLGLIRPGAGEATFAGVAYARLPHPSSQVGAVLEDASFHPGRSGRNHLRVLAAAGRHPESRVAEVLERVGLSDAADRRVKGYSMGMRQRLAIAAALLGDPDVLILDEPTNGLDPPGIRWMRDLLRSEAARGAAVLVSSHLLSEVAQSVDDVVVIARGRLRGSGTLQSVLGGSNGPVTRVRAATTPSGWPSSCGTRSRRSSRTGTARCWYAAPRPSGWARWRRSTGSC